MQLIINLSKNILLTFLICNLLVAWNETHLLTMNLSIKDEKATSFSPVFIGINKKSESIWEKMRAQFQLDTKLQSIEVRRELQQLLRDQDKLYKILNAAKPYLYFIYNQIEARGLPAEIALIPLIESEFNPNDYSNKGAIGLWQLMAGTARDLGINIKAGYDGRRNVVASTEAALSYFDDLGAYFKGDWYLAIAAYNSGQMKVKSAIRKSGSKDFFRLPLPKETKHYVPRLLAIAAIIKTPEKYGIELPIIENSPFFTEIKIKKPVNLTKIAKLSGINVKILANLNPDYRKGRTPKLNVMSLLVPIDKAPLIKQCYGAI